MGTQGLDAELSMKLYMRLSKMKHLTKNVEPIMKIDARLEQSAHLIQTPNVPQNIVSNVETGPKRNVLTPGEMIAAPNKRRNVRIIIDQSKSRTLKMNVSQRKKRDVKNIGKNQPLEKRFGWKIQLPASGTMPLNVLLLLNTEPNKRRMQRYSIPRLPRLPKGKVCSLPGLSRLPSTK